MDKLINGPAYSDPFLFLTSEERDWLNVPLRGEKKDLALEAIDVCICLVLPSSSSADRPHLSERDVGKVLRRWHQSLSNGSYRLAVDRNICTAIEISNRYKLIGDSRDLIIIADTFLRSARQQRQQLLGSGHTGSTSIVQYDK